MHDFRRTLMIARTLWICLSNAAVVAAILVFLPAREWDPIHHPLAVFLVAGIVLEIFRFRVAKYFNVGAFLAVASYWIAAYLFSLKELFGFFGSGEILPYVEVFALPALVIAALNFAIYRISDRPVQEHVRPAVGN